MYIFNYDCILKDFEYNFIRKLTVYWSEEVIQSPWDCNKGISCGDNDILLKGNTL